MPRQVPERQPLRERLRVATEAALAAQKPSPKARKAAPKRRKIAAKKPRPRVTKPASKMAPKINKPKKSAKRVKSTKPSKSVAKSKKTAGKLVKKKSTRKAGRPAFHFDKDQIEELEKLAGLQCTRVEVAGWFGIAKNTLKLQFKRDKRVEPAWENGQQRGRVSLRRYQFALAQKNAAMGIWLGKQILGQKDISLHGHAEVDGKDLDIKPQDMLLAQLKKHKLAVGEAVH